MMEWQPDKATQRILEWARELIQRPSVTPDDADCQVFVGDLLARWGFQLEHYQFLDDEQPTPIQNLWAIWTPPDALHPHRLPLLAYVGHTDVVPPGPLTDWHEDPFKPIQRESLLTGRGAVDMKGSIAAFLAALAHFFETPRHRTAPFRLGLLLTSDEEGPSVYGVQAVLPLLAAKGQLPHYALVGEPVSEHHLADCIKIGRRGSLNATITFHGRSGHSARPQAADNALHRATAAIHKLLAVHWDTGSRYFPPTTLQVTHLQSGTGAYNVIPGTASFKCNWRFSDVYTEASLKEKIGGLLNLVEAPCGYDVVWACTAHPFLSPNGPLRQHVIRSIQNVMGHTPLEDTSGGTSDARFFAPYHVETVDLGPLHHTLHAPNETVSLVDLERLARIYFEILSEWSL